MLRNISWRMIAVLAVATLSILFIIPTMDYFNALAKKPFPQEKDYSPGGVLDKAGFDQAVRDYHTYMTNKRRGWPLLGHPIPLGLDLQGGVDVLLAISREKIVEDELLVVARKIRQSLINDEIDAQVDLNAAKDGLVVKLRDTMAQDPSKVHDAELILKDQERNLQPWNAANLANPEKGVTLRFKPDVIEIYSRNSINSAVNVVTRRVDELGVTQPKVAKVGNQYIWVQVPGESDPQRIIDQVIRPANLSFHLVHKDQETLLGRDLKFDDYGQLVSGQVPARYVVMMGEAVGPNTHTIKVKTALRAEEAEKKVGYYVVKETPELTGRELVDARYYYNPTNVGGSPHEVNIEFNKEGTRIFRDVTRDHLNEPMAIVLEGKVMSAPVLRAHITDGRARIFGSFTSDEARDLSLVLRAGALPATLRVEQQQSVGATLGTDSVRNGVSALLIGSALVILFMIAYYFGAGVIAVIALIINVLILVAVMALSRATLTLSGIGGILLTVGMAVDSNVLIYERLREEMKSTSSLKAALAKAFDKAGLTIWDANLTTLIATLVLLQLGTLSVQGFALTTTIGIFTTLFTGLFVTKTLCDSWAASHDRLATGALHLMDNPHYDFLKYRYHAYAFSAFILLVGVAGMGYNKAQTGNWLKLGIEFAQGVKTEVQFHDKTDEAAIRTAIPSAQVQRVVGADRFIITNKLVEHTVENTQAYIREKLTAAFPGNFNVIGEQGVGEESGGKFILTAFWCALLAAGGILLYVWFRFELDFGVASVLALFHDVLIALFLVQLCGYELTLDVVAALLIIFGYSINDTIVIFDRIRENLRSVSPKRFGELLNSSNNQCLSRTIITSSATLISVIAMLILGGEGLRGFALTLFFGMVSGCYSTIFIATASLYEWRIRKVGALELVAAPAGPAVSVAATEAVDGGDEPSVGASAAPKKKEGPRTHGVRVEPIR